MEVHNHTHTKRTKWTHYLWEFIMLFLAVYLGFMAENWREHKIENHRAHNYIETFYEDLKNDKGRLNSLIANDSKKIAALATLKSCYDSLLQNEDPVSLLRIIKHSLANNIFLSERRTIDQLANAGGYRLLKRQDADSIASYSNQCTGFAEFQSTAYQQTQDELRTLFNETVDFTAYADLFPDITNQTFPDSTESGIPLFGHATKDQLKKFFNTLIQYTRVTVRNRNLLQRLLSKADRLLDYFGKRYDLNN
jgi:hypothetical protein